MMEEFQTSTTNADNETTSATEEKMNLIEEMKEAGHEYYPVDEIKESLERKSDIVYEEKKEEAATERDMKISDPEAIAEAEKRSIKKEKAEKKNKKAKEGGIFSIFNKAGKKKEIHHINKTVQQTIPYRNVYRNGIIEVEEGYFSKSYLLQDINFRIAPDEEQESIFRAYGELLNSFGHECYVSITINNKSMNINRFNRETLIQMAGDELDIYRREINDMLKERMTEGKNNLVHEKYLTIGMYCPNIEEATAQFSRIDSLVSKYMRKVSKQANCEPMTLEDRLAIMYDVYNLDNEFDFGLTKMSDDGEEIKSFSLKALNDRGLTTKDIIGPSSFLFEKNYFQMGETYGQALYIENYASSLRTDLLPEITDLATNMLCTTHFVTMRRDKAIKMIKNRMTAIDSSVVDAQKKANSAGYSADLISPELQRQQEEAKMLLEDVTKRNQMLFFVTLVIVHFADSKDELEKNQKTLETILNRHLCTIKPLSYQQEYGLASAFPLGYNKIKASALNTTETASVFIPFSAQEWYQKRGFYYGLNTVSRNMIIYNRKNGQNYNGVTLGQPGSGKSFSSKREICNVLLSTNDEVYVIDPEREYVALANLLGGEVVKISAGTDIHLNPFDLDIDDCEEGQDPVTIKSDFIGALCEIIIGGAYGLTPIQRSVIDRCCRKVYEPYIQEMNRRKSINPKDTFDPSIAPTLKDFYECLKNQDEPEAAEIALSLEIYITGSLNTFAGKTNVNTKNRFVVFDIKDIGTGMMELGLQICLNTIWGKMIQNKRRKLYTWMYIDEFHLFARRESSAQYIRNIYKRARKWFGIPTGMTQNVGDLLQSETCASVITTSEFVMLLNQTPIDKMRLSGMFKLSEEEQEYITDADRGQGLLVRNEKSKIPFTDHFPNDTKLYAAMTTKADDENNSFASV